MIESSEYQLRQSENETLMKRRENIVRDIKLVAAMLDNPRELLLEGERIWDQNGFDGQVAINAWTDLTLALGRSEDYLGRSTLLQYDLEDLNVAPDLFFNRSVACALLRRTEDLFYNELAENQPPLDVAAYGRNEAASKASGLENDTIFTGEIAKIADIPITVENPTDAATAMTLINTMQRVMPPPHPYRVSQIAFVREAHPSGCFVNDDKTVIVRIDNDEHDPYLSDDGELIIPPFPVRPEDNLLRWYAFILGHELRHADQRKMLGIVKEYDAELAGDSFVRHVTEAAVKGDLDDIMPLPTRQFPFWARDTFAGRRRDILQKIANPDPNIYLEADHNLASTRWRVNRKLDNSLA